MTRTSNLELSVILFAMIGIAALVLLSFLGGGDVGTITIAPQQVDISWTFRERGFKVPQGLPFHQHARDHLGQKLDAWKIYDLFLEGKCAAEGRWCGKDHSGSKELWLCDDPTTGLLGALVIYLDGPRAPTGPRIYTGYGTHKIETWRSRIWFEENWGEQWGPCP